MSRKIDAVPRLDQTLRPREAALFRGLEALFDAVERTQERVRRKPAASVLVSRGENIPQRMLRVRGGFEAERHLPSRL